MFVPVPAGEFCVRTAWYVVCRLLQRAQGVARRVESANADIDTIGMHRYNIAL